MADAFGSGRGGVDNAAAIAFSTDPDIDQRATAELRARLDEYTPPEQRTRLAREELDALLELVVVAVRSVRRRAHQHAERLARSSGKRRKHPELLSRRSAPASCAKRTRRPCSSRRR